ncbi:hypothetical protein P9695_14915 [Weizmannia sp. CD-2023]|uniref:deoxynucleotide monophosphate kinase family protein n=1 Tax=Heyndrickxia TaxID=2837504 RepID=UPI002E2499C9|nr:hypothetical protein [Weizmannia sp. CD-2023]MED4899789.1 hypothetical protein [Weizmannia sp. CD-2023]
MEGVGIALTAEMRSGKDTIGKILIEEYGFKRYAFGDGIVEICKQLFPHMFTGTKPRKLLQEFGQEQVARHRTVWIDYMFAKMQTDGIDPQKDNIVITDLRQPHEYKALVDCGFYVVRVNASLETRIERMLKNGELVSPEILEHNTEKHIRNYKVDYEIDNNGTPEQLYENVKEMIRFIGGMGREWSYIVRNG